jgi:hypothetical protein
MAISFGDAQDIILARLKASAIPNVFEAAVPAGFILPTQNNAHLPYVCMSFGGKSPVAARSGGITSSRDDIKRTSITVECIGDSPHDVRKVTEIVRDTLEGFIVDESWGELSETLAGDYAMYAPDYALWPIRFATGIFYYAFTNATTS